MIKTVWDVIIEKTWVHTIKFMSIYSGKPIGLLEIDLEKLLKQIAE